ncbi:MAG: ABC transporter ATP-binding protein [Thermodesulfobacteriota bacterium]|nr:ABC transporter ATP-binding protein [Thermodesulfobacteriota bacterium]
MKDKVIRMKQVAKDFFDGKQLRRVLHSTDLEILSAELTVIAGPSGSGKTTLLTIMGLILKSSEGKIYVRDKDVTGLSEDDLATIRLNNYGFVFQTAVLIPALTVMENVLLAPSIQGARVTSAIRKRAEKTLEQFGLTEYSDTKAQQLSGGQKQRIAIVRALVNAPVLILCDEPTSALDVESSSVVLNTLKQLSKDENRGVVLVTHDPRVFPYADRLIKVEDGRVSYDTRNSVEIEREF